MSDDKEASAKEKKAKRNDGARARMGLNLKPLQTEEAVKEAVPEENIQKIGPEEAIKKLEDLYEFEEKIYDAGDRSRVFCGKDIRPEGNGNPVIIKLRKKDFFSGGERVWRQILTRMLNLDKNDHVLGLTGIYEDDRAYYTVMEKCHGGELFDFLLNETDVPEKECKRIMRDILKAVDHMHSQGLIHRDIKPENIMFANKQAEDDPKSPKTLKLIDFDTCQEHVPNSPKAQKIVGTPGYIAPEAFKGEYTPASDLWSVGVILYILMTGDMPFSDEDIGEDLAGDNRVGGSKAEETFERLKDAKIDFDCAPWPDFPQARDLCASLLAFDPGDRSPGAKEALNHPWLREGDKA